MMKPKSHIAQRPIVVKIVLLWLAVIAITGFIATQVSGDQQPTVTMLPTKDGYVASGRPDESWPGFPSLWIGHDQSAGYGNQRILLQFDLSQIPEVSHINSARLRLHLIGTTPGDAPMSIVACMIGNNWQEDVTWNQQQSLPCISAAPTAATLVGIQPITYDWNVGSVLQYWVDNRPPDNAFSLRLTGNESSGQHERVFWSRDCPVADCDGNRPVLEVDFSEPPTDTPTPTTTHTATATHTPTATHTATSTTTPTPTPGLSLFYLSNNPPTAIEPGGIIEYSIIVHNGQQPLTGVEVANPVPTGVAVITQDATPGPTVSENEIKWVIGNLSAGATKVLSYRASRPTGVPTVTVIVNTGAIGTGEFAGTPIPTMRSNGVTNPSGQFFNYIYLPLLLDKAG